MGAAFELGILGGAKNETEAVKWYRKAAEQGDADAQRNLARCYLDGQRVAQDKGEAVNWYRKAAEQGDVDAQYNLGVCYCLGKGVSKDEVEGVKWYRKAAEQNYTPAQYKLGLCYFKSKGMAKDYVEAYKWMLLAAGRGDENAKRGVSKLEARMTLEQVAEGQKRAQDFKPSEVPSTGSDGSGAGTTQTRP